MKQLSASLARAWDAFAGKPVFDPHIDYPNGAGPSTNPHPRPNIRDIIAGVKLPNTAEQAAMIKGLGFKTVEPTIKIQSPFRAVAPPDPAPAPLKTETLKTENFPNPADPLVPFSTIKAHCAQQDHELATAHAHIAELENKLRWSHQRETALREELHDERNPPVHTSPSSPSSPPA